MNIFISLINPKDILNGYICHLNQKIWLRYRLKYGTRIYNMLNGEFL